jgi:hypothetical protein
MELLWADRHLYFSSLVLLNSDSSRPGVSSLSNTLGAFPK